MLSPTQTDAEVLAALHSQCFQQGWSAEAFRQLLQADTTLALLAQDHAEQAGFIVLQIVADEAEILTLGVIPERRRTGFARELVLEAAREACVLGVQRLFLEVCETNTAALNLYRQLGFEETGRRRNYYNSCDSLADALILRRLLPIPAWESANDSIIVAAGKNAGSNDAN